MATWALFIHVPMFGSVNVDSKPIVCARCGQNKWLWDKGPAVNSDGNEEIACADCGQTNLIFWPVLEPDHISTWLNSEYCPHSLCRIKYAALCREMEWKGH
jgi:hypothetical protein